MKNTNIEMLIFKAIGIILVVSCHLESNFFNIIIIPISSNSELFPEYSFHMPLFIFASGYFYKEIYEKNIYEYFKKKSKSILNYFKCNFFYCILVFTLIKINFLNEHIDFSLKSFFIEPFLGGFQFHFNGPGWFVPFLFLTQIIYVSIRIIFKKMFSFLNIKKLEFSFFFLLSILSVLSVFISNINPVLNKIVLVNHLFLRITFGLVFFELGFLFKEFLENKITLNIKTFAIIILIKFIIFKYIGFYSFSMRTLAFNNHIFLPFIFSILGIFYSIHLSKFISKAPKLIVDFFCFIGNNTWSIMMHHLFIKFLIRTFLNTKLINLNLYNILDYFITPILCLILPLALIYFKIKFFKFYKLKFQSTTI